MNRRSVKRNYGVSPEQLILRKFSPADDHRVDHGGKRRPRQGRSPSLDQAPDGAFGNGQVNDLAIPADPYGLGLIQYEIA